MIAYNACSTADNMCQFHELCQMNFSISTYYTCACPNSLMALQTDGHTCADINECLQTPSVCGQYQTCTNINITGYTNLTRGYTCTCNTWFVKDPSNYTNCFAQNPCDYNCTESSEVCTNYGNGNYSCTCASGYMAVNDTCEAIDYCATAGICGSGNCTNVPGSYQCSCPTGYYFDNKTCLSVDYCSTLANSTCVPPAMICVNFQEDITARAILLEDISSIAGSCYCRQHFINVVLFCFLIVDYEYVAQYNVNKYHV